jgi:MFS family permease
MGVRTVVALLINPLWSRLSNRRGNKIVMQLATAVGVIMMAWTVFMPSLARSLNVPATTIAYAIVPVFALLGIYETGVGIGAVNLTLEVAPPHDRAIYIGLTNTILGVAYLSTAVSGLIVDVVGYEGVFVLGLILLLVATWALWRLRDPRELPAERKTHAS